MKTWYYCYVFFAGDANVNDCRNRSPTIADEAVIFKRIKSHPHTWIENHRSFNSMTIDANETFEQKLYSFIHWMVRVCETIFCIYSKSNKSSIHRIEKFQNNSTSIQILWQKKAHTPSINWLESVHHTVGIIKSTAKREKKKMYRGRRRKKKRKWKIRIEFHWIFNYTLCKARRVE